MSCSLIRSLPSSGTSNMGMHLPSTSMITPTIIFYNGITITALAFLPLASIHYTDLDLLPEIAQGIAILSLMQSIMGTAISLYIFSHNPHNRGIITSPLEIAAKASINYSLELAIHFAVVGKLVYASQREDSARQIDSTSHNPDTTQNTEHHDLLYAHNNAEDDSANNGSSHDSDLIIQSLISLISDYR